MIDDQDVLLTLTYDTKQIMELIESALSSRFEIFVINRKTGERHTLASSEIEEIRHQHPLTAKIQLKKSTYTNKNLGRDGWMAGGITRTRHEFGYAYDYGIADIRGNKIIADKLLKLSNKIPSRKKEKTVINKKHIQSVSSLSDNAKKAANFRHKNTKIMKEEVYRLYELHKHICKSSKSAAKKIAPLLRDFCLLQSKPIPLLSVDNGERTIANWISIYKKEIIS
ncbi:MAG: hypothetical protein ABI597_13910 [Gammaproteobacteria bacterium]